MINEELQKCNDYCTDAAVVASDAKNRDTAPLEIKINAVKQKTEAQEL